jgi:hypothetical protein
MAAESNLADLYVNFSSRNSKALDKEIDAKRGRLLAAAQAAGHFAKQAAGGFAAGAAAVGRFAAVAAAAGAGLVARGLAGTREAAALGSAFTLLSRIVADVFAPAVRVVTQAVIELARWWLSLDKETRHSIQTWVLLGAAVAAAAAAFPLVKTAATAFISVIGLLPAKFTAVALAIGGVIVALELLSDKMLDWENKQDGMLKRAAAGWAGLKGIIGGAVQAASGGTFKEGFREWSGLNDQMKKYLDSRGLTESAKEILREKYPDRPEFKPSELEQRAQGMLGRWKQMFQGMFDVSENSAIGRVLQKFNDRRPVQVVHKVDFLSLDEVWRKAQREASERGNDQQRQADELEQMRRDIGWIRENGVKIINPPPAWV